MKYLFLKYSKNRNAVVKWQWLKVLQRQEVAVIKNNRILKCLLMMVIGLLLVLNFSIGVSASSGYDRQEVDACITISQRLSVKSGSKTNTKPYTNSRPSFRKGVVEQVWENAKGPDGLVRDPNTGEVINWTPGESRKGVWDMGHIPEAKYSKRHEAYMNGKLTTKEFVDWYNDPANYRPELPSNNRSHKYE